VCSSGPASPWSARSPGSSSAFVSATSPPAPGDRYGRRADPRHSCRRRP
jgi:hypothetical protein